MLCSPSNMFSSSILCCCWSLVRANFLGSATPTTWNGWSWVNVVESYSDHLFKKNSNLLNKYLICVTFYLRATNSMDLRICLNCDILYFSFMGILSWSYLGSFGPHRFFGGSMCIRINTVNSRTQSTEMIGWLHQVVSVRQLLLTSTRSGWMDA